MMDLQGGCEMVQYGVMYKILSLQLILVVLSKASITIANA